MRHIGKLILLTTTLTFTAWTQPVPVVHGSGTTNTIAYWTSPATIGNSTLSQSGGNLSTSGGITAASFTGNGAAVTNVNAAKLGGILPSGFAQLQASSNSFTGSLSASTISSTNPYQIGGTNVLSVAGSENLFVGVGAGANNTGFSNTATGWKGLGSNTSGSSNTANGFEALAFNTTGAGNTATGSAAMGSNTTGDYNTAYGLEAFINNTTGNNNTAIGAYALAASFQIGSTGSGNIALGFRSGSNFNGDESGNIDINSLGATGDNGVIRIGDSSTVDSTCILGCKQTATYIAGINGVTTGSYTTSTVLIDSNGQLGTIVSSRRYKEDIADMGAASDGLLRLRPVTFRYKKTYADGSKPLQYGLVAEEVAEVYPDLVVRGKDGLPETVQYYKLDAMVLNELQKLVRLHAADKKEIVKLQSEITEQQKQAQEQEAAVMQLQTQLRMIQLKLANVNIAQRQDDDNSAVAPVTSW